MSDLDDLLPPTRNVRAGAGTIDVRPLQVRQLPAVARALRDIPQGVLDALGGGEVDVLMLMESAEPIARVLAAATDEPLERLLALNPVDFATLCMTVFEVNADFFVRGLSGPLAQARARIGGMNGQTPSST